MNVLERAKAIIPHIRNSYLNQHFPDNFMQNLPHDRVLIGCCIKCGRSMAQHEMHPPGKVTPRAICHQCWAVMTSYLSQDCWVCGNPLDKNQLSGQQYAPRDLHHRIHGGECADYFSIVSARALGVDTGVCERNQPDLARSDPIISHQPQPQIAYKPQQTVNEIIDMIQIRQPLPIKVK